MRRVEPEYVQIRVMFDPHDDLYVAEVRVFDEDTTLWHKLRGFTFKHESPSKAFEKALSRAQSFHLM